MARVVFMGTPEAAVPTLDSVAGVHEVGLVVTQPDRPKGRSSKPVASPVKEFATSLGLTVSQPSSHQELKTFLEEHGPFDVGVVVAYGRLLRSEILETPARGLLNLHFSLLPRWRGAAPVARALIAGDDMTGVTIIKLDEGLDTGPVLTAQAIDIPRDDNAGDLTQRLADLGAQLLVDVLGDYLSGELEPVPQTDDGATYADKIDRHDRPIAPDTDAVSVVAQIRGLAPSPTATLVIDGETYKIHEARLVDSHLEPGTWRAIDGRPLVGFRGGAVELISIQPPGRNPRSGSDWVNGQRTDGGVVE